MTAVAVTSLITREGAGVPKAAANGESYRLISESSFSKGFSPENINS